MCIRDRARIDYVMMVDALTMQPIENADRDVLVAMAVYIGKTRLIDNFSYGAVSYTHLDVYKRQVQKTA